MPEGVTCICCGEFVPYNRTNCPHGTLVGYPNVRRAQNMRAALLANYDAAVTGANARSVFAEIGQLWVIADDACATINVSPKILRNLSYSQPYRSYYNALDDGDRQIAMQQHHGTRQAVDAKIHTGYEKHILNAALSGDERGLTNYGPITVRFKPEAIEDMSTLLRENAFDFYKRHALGDLDAIEPEGWRATWEDRAFLVVAALADRVVAGMGDDDLQDLVLATGSTRHDDRYIEVHIFGGVSWQAIASVCREAALSDPRDTATWHIARERLERRGVQVTDYLP